MGDATEEQLDVNALRGRKAQKVEIRLAILMRRGRAISKTDRGCGAVTGVKFPSIICRAVASAVRLESWSTVRFIFVH